MRITFNKLDPITTLDIFKWIYGNTMRSHFCVGMEMSKKDKVHFHVYIGESGYSPDELRCEFQKDYPLYKGNKFLQIKLVRDVGKYISYVLKDQETSANSDMFMSEGFEDEYLKLKLRQSHRKGLDNFMNELNHLDDLFISRGCSERLYSRKWRQLKGKYNQNINFQWVVQHLYMLKTKREDGEMCDIDDYIGRLMTEPKKYGQFRIFE